MCFSLWHRSVQLLFHINPIALSYKIFPSSRFNYAQKDQVLWFRDFVLSLGAGCNKAPPKVLKMTFCLEIKKNSHYLCCRYS